MGRSRQICDSSQGHCCSTWKCLSPRGENGWAREVRERCPGREKEIVHSHQLWKEKWTRKVLVILFPCQISLKVFISWALPLGAFLVRLVLVYSLETLPLTREMRCSFCHWTQFVTYSICKSQNKCAAVAPSCSESRVIDTLSVCYWINWYNY